MNTTTANAFPGYYTIRPKGGRFAAQMNKAAKLDLFWVEADRCWATNDSMKASTMRRLGADVTEGAPA